MDGANMAKEQTPVPTLSTNSGSPVEDNQNRITAWPRGPALLQDDRLLEKLATFNRERIPERIVHAKGSAAHGTLTITNDITKYSNAAVFSKVGKEVPAYLRFSTVAGERGAADAERDVREAHRYRLGVNHDLIPVNKPSCPVMNYHRDSFKRVDANGGGRVNYEPNSLNGPMQRAAFDESPWRIAGFLTIGIATMLSLVLVQLITAGP
jgi:catalase